MDSSRKFTELLNWQQTRRGQGIPTTTVLAGPVGLGVREWRAWAGTHGRPVAQTDATDPTGLSRAWIEAVFGAADVCRASIGWLATASGQTPDAAHESVRRMTVYDLDRAWQTLPTDTTTPPAAVARFTLGCVVAGRSPDADGLVRTLGAEPTRAVRAVAALMADDVCPALLLVPPTSDDLAQTLGVLEEMAVAVPGLPIAVAASDAAYEAADRALAGTRRQTLAREGLVRVRGVSGDALLDRLRRAGVAPDPPPETVRRLTAEGLPEEAAVAFIETAVAVRSTPNPADKARSSAEAFLFEQLESLPATAGLFRLNRELDFRHGPRAAEADLFAESVRLVIEVDGSYYHLTAEQYRRDRRKDWEYQRRGYWVLRFLAEDVVDDLEAILDTILGVVAARRPPAPGGAL